MSSSTVPPGYRFYPTEEELIEFFLQNKLDNRRADMELVIPAADVYCLDPWNLPPMAGETCRRDGEQWFFFCPRQEREAQGGRPTRTTPSGYWKATGSPNYVYSSAANGRVLGMKRTMVFYQGKAPTGTKTRWKMNEYRAAAPPAADDSAPSSTATPKLRNEFSLCRMYTKSGCIRSFDRRPGVAAGEAAEGTNPREAAAAAPSASEPEVLISGKRSYSIINDSSSSDGGNGCGSRRKCAGGAVLIDEEQEEEDDCVGLLLQGWF